MCESVSSTELLDFLAKANKVSSHVTVTKGNGVYYVSACADWDDNGYFNTCSTSITEEGHSDCGFFTMNSMLDELVKKEEEKEMKRQKRQKLLSRLTNEEKELLGVK